MIEEKRRMAEEEARHAADIAQREAAHNEEMRVAEERFKQALLEAEEKISELEIRCAEVLENAPWWYYSISTMVRSVEPRAYT